MGTCASGCGNSSVRENSDSALKSVAPSLPSRSQATVDNGRHPKHKPPTMVRPTSAKAIGRDIPMSENLPNPNVSQISNSRPTSAASVGWGVEESETELHTAAETGDLNFIKSSSQVERLKRCRPFHNHIHS